MHRRLEVSILNANSVAFGITYERSIECLNPTEDPYTVHMAKVFRIGFIFFQIKVVTFREED